MDSLPQHAWCPYAGSLLLRNTRDDHVFYIVADELKQIDLSSDQVVAQLFKDGQWEAAAAPLYFASQVCD